MIRKATAEEQGSVCRQRYVKHVPTTALLIERYKDPSQLLHSHSENESRILLNPLSAGMSPNYVYTLSPKLEERSECSNQKNEPGAVNRDDSLSAFDFGSYNYPAAASLQDFYRTGHLEPTSFASGDRDLTGTGGQYQTEEHDSCKSIEIPIVLSKR
jgi:hypothetical protein